MLLDGKIGVIGAGQMGTGIAIVGAMNAKTNVLIMDASKENLEKSQQFASTYCT